MLEWLKLGLEAVKQAGVYAPVAALLASSIILFLPNAWLGSIGLQAFKTNNIETIGLAFVVSLVATMIQLIIWLKRTLWDSRQARKSLEKRLHNLSYQEKQILCAYVLNKVKTQYFRIEDGVVQGLVHSRILYLSSNMGSLIRGFSYNIQLWAYEYLSENTHLITEGVPFEAPNVIAAYESEADPLRGLL